MPCNHTQDPTADKDQNIVHNFAPLLFLYSCTSLSRDISHFPKVKYNLVFFNPDVLDQLLFIWSLLHPIPLTLHSPNLGRYILNFLNKPKKLLRSTLSYTITGSIWHYYHYRLLNEPKHRSVLWSKGAAYLPL